MGRTIRLALAAVLCFTTLAATPASAKTNPSFTSDFSMTAVVWGQTNFTVSGGTGVKATVTVNAVGAAVTPTSVTVRVQRQVCGTFGCNWRDQDSAYQGGTCTIYPTSTAAVSKGCSFSAPDSTRLHRLVIQKYSWDGNVYTGTASVS